MISPNELQGLLQLRKATQLQKMMIQSWISYPNLQVTEVKASAHFQEELHTILI